MTTGIGTLCPGGAPGLALARHSNSLIDSESEYSGSSFCSEDIFMLSLLLISLRYHSLLLYRVSSSFPVFMNTLIFHRNYLVDPARTL